MTDNSMFEETVRVDRLFWLPGALMDPEVPPDDFDDEFVRCLPDGAHHALYRQLPALAKFADTEDWPEAVDVAYALYELPGFLVQAATPYRTKTGHYSWGHYWTEWLYAPTEGDITRVCVEWAKERVEEHTAASEPQS